MLQGEICASTIVLMPALDELSPTYSAESYPMLIKSRPLYDIWLKCIIDQWDKLKSEGLKRLIDIMGTETLIHLENGRSGYAMT